MRLREGDFLTDPVGGPYDFAWVSQILHAYAEKDCLSLLRRARAALRPGDEVQIGKFKLVFRAGQDGPR